MDAQQQLGNVTGCAALTAPSDISPPESCGTEQAINIQNGLDARIAVAQISTDPGKLTENTQKIIRVVEEASAQGSEIVVFPELTIPGYGHLDLANDIEFVKANKNCLQEIAPATAGLTALVGFIDYDEDSRGPEGNPVLYNAVAVIHNGEVVATRRKTLLPTYNIFDERRYYTPGADNHIVEVGGKKLGIGICEDLWQDGYAQNVYPGLIEEGADILINLSASPFHIGKFNERLGVVDNVLQQKRLPVIYANLVGSFDGYEGEVVFDGRSMIFGPDGKLCSVGKGFGEDLIVCDMKQATAIELPEVTEVHELYDALILGIRDYFRRNNRKKAYIGLSGGIDSAVVASLAVAALGRSNVIGVTMPSHITSSETRDDALELARNLGIQCDIRPIGPVYQAWLAGFCKAKAEQPKSLTKQNFQARARGAILMEYANEDSGGLVISTGNKTEMGLGYCTLYGDMNGGLAALSDVNKLRVYELARYVNQIERREVIPNTTIVRIPSAELEEGQTDVANLPADYDVLAPLVDAIIEARISKAELEQKYGERVVSDVIRMINRNEFKRRQAPPGIRVTPRAFGVGRRLPMGL